MSEAQQKLRRFFRELKRRKVYRVAAAYAAVALVVVEAADLIFPALGIPPWGYRLVVLLALLGFPVAVVLAWAFDLTPEGVRATTALPDASGPEARRPRWVGGVLALVVLLGGATAAWYLMDGGAEASGISDRSIAVLPFASLGREEPGPFAEGIHDDVLTRLSSVADFRVIARTSVERYRGSGKSPGEIARELGVRWVLDGGVQERDDRIKLNVRLIDPRTESNAWAQAYERELTAENLFAIQAEITRRIVAALEARLTAGEERSVARRPTRDLEAYRLYVRGRAALRGRRESGMRQGLALFQRAIARDSGYALAWVGVADALYLLADYGLEPPRAVLPTALAAARRGLALGPELAEAHGAMAMLEHLRQHGPDALRGLRRAVELRPNYAVGHNQLAWVGQLVGRPDLAFEAARRALELDPLAPEPHANLALMLLARGEGDEALGVIRAGKEVQPEWATSRFYEGVVLHHLGRHDEAIAALEGPSIPWAGAGRRATLALALVASGDTARARGLLDRLEADGAHPFLVGLVHAGLGEEEAAFAAFASIEGWTPDARWPILSARYLFPAELGALRGDPRYRRMLRAIDRAWGMDA